MNSTAVLTVRACLSVSQDNEAFLHRSGRTGRAGKNGTAVILYGERDARNLGQLFRETKVSMTCGSVCNMMTCRWLYDLDCLCSL